MSSCLRTIVMSLTSIPIKGSTAVLLLMENPVIQAEQLRSFENFSSIVQVSNVLKKLRVIYQLLQVSPIHF